MQPWFPVFYADFSSLDVKMEDLRKKEKGDGSIFKHNAGE